MSPNTDMFCQQDIMDASGVALVLIGPGSIDQVYLTYNVLICTFRSDLLGWIFYFFFSFLDVVYSFTHLLDKVH